MKKKWFRSPLLAVALLTIIASAQAAVPRRINYQGYLTNAEGAPQTGTFDMVFSLCDAEAGGSCPWSETQSVLVEEGVFNVLLGTVTPLTLPFDIPYYMEVSVAGETLSPRKPLAAGGYALNAGRAESVADGSITNAGISGAAAIDVLKISGLGGLATKSSIVESDISGTIASTKISGLGALASKSTITNADVDTVAAIADSKLATITTAGKVANSATTATSANTANALVVRDASGNFSAGTITASLNGNASTAASVTGTVPVANGGTGATSAAAALNNLLPAQVGNNGKVLSTDGVGTTSWIPAGGGADTTLPVPGSPGTITATNSGADIALSWAAATDNVTPQTNLQYTVFYSKLNNISTVANAEANGTVFGFPWANNLTSRTVTGLTFGSTYYFNVVVMDADHNKNIYATTVKALTIPANNIVLYGMGTPLKCNLGGRAGANALCSASANKPAGFANTAAFLSVDASDTIAGRQAFGGLNTTYPIRSTNGTLIASNWADLLDGSIATTLAAAGVQMPTGYWKSGSKADGTLGQTCNGWTVGANGTGALVDWGVSNSATSTWIYDPSGQNYCGEPEDFLCIAW